MLLMVLVIIFQSLLNSYDVFSQICSDFYTTLQAIELSRSAQIYVGAPEVIFCNNSLPQLMLIFSNLTLLVSCSFQSIIKFLTRTFSYFWSNPFRLFLLSITLYCCATVFGFAYAYISLYLPSLVTASSLTIFILFSIVMLIMFINITLIAGIIPLIERKYLSLIQRRVGPHFIGYKGRLQFIADALKLFFKELSQPAYLNKHVFIFLPSIVLGVSYLFWINTLWSKNLMFVYIEYNLLFFNFLSIIFEFLIILTGSINKNKYSFLSSIRSVIILFSVELLFTFFLLFIINYTGSLSLYPCFLLNEEWYFIFNFVFILNVLYILLFLETCRAPFDVNEAESELITGYHIEYSSFLFGLYYLAEYFNLFFFSAFFVIVLVDEFFIYVNFIW